MKMASRNLSGWPFLHRWMSLNSPPPKTGIRYNVTGQCVDEDKIQAEWGLKQRWAY